MRSTTRSLADAAIFAALAIGLAVQAVRLGGYAWLLLWLAAGFAAIAVAYAGAGVRLFGKHPTGGFGRAASILHAPARSTFEVIWWLRRAASREASFHEITPTLFLGRRPIRRLPKAVVVIVDLAGELAASRLARRCAGYRSVPVLDRSTGDDEDYVALVGAIARDARPTLVHCAQGHGRSAQVVAGVLLARGVAQSPEDAVRWITQRRPGVRLARPQREQLERTAERLRRAAD